MEIEWIGYMICALIIISGCLIHVLSPEVPRSEQKQGRSAPAQMKGKG